MRSHFIIANVDVAAVATIRSFFVTVLLYFIVVRYLIETL